MLQVLGNFLGNPNQRKIRKIEPLLDDVAHYEEDLSRLSDEQLRAKTDFFKAELRNRPRDPNPEKDFLLEQELLDTLLPEAFAVVREAGKRVLGMRHYDVQLLGGYVLHKGGIAEMRTGEGKTLVATLPAYLNALTGKGVHVVTVNDYLARRDAEWMGQLFRFLGLTVGVVLSEQRGFNAQWEKRQAYAADITYGTNNEFGFDYLRDNMAKSKSQLVQRPFNFAIVDEVDSILIDEARTPLIISGKLQQSAETYVTMAKIAPLLKKEDDYTVDEKARNVILTEEGIDRAQEILGLEDLFDPKTNLAHHLLCALKAKELFRRDIDYVVKDDEVVIVDEFTGRLMEGRRWSDGLHQAVEAKEGVHIQDETQTLASITFQNLFRLYPKLSGMTGTALTEEAEFGKIYKLDVTAIPTNRSDVREDLPDEIYKTEAVKFIKVAESVTRLYEEGRPVLVGTTSIEKSEYLSRLLTDPATMAEHLQQKAQRLLAYLDNRKEAKAVLQAPLQAIMQQSSQQLEQLAKTEKALQEADIADWLENLLETVRALETIRKGIPHAVLNAKLHEQEATIVAQAGRYKAVTIATNMAGRGTDILLGGNPEFLVRSELAEQDLDWRELPEQEYKARVAAKKQETDAAKQQVLALGGLHIIGTERHESRRIDNQLRGRAGRQGDPGSTRFYLSLQDSLMRLFGGQRIAGLMDMMSVEETLPISAGLVNRAIESAQRKVEAHHFDIRKNILQYDDVLTEQRKLIYDQRKRVLNLEGLRESVRHMVALEMQRSVGAHVTPDFIVDDSQESQQSLQEILTAVKGKVPQLPEDLEPGQFKGYNYAALVEYFVRAGEAAYDQLENQLTQVANQLREQHGVSLSGLEADEEAELETQNLAPQELAERRHPLRRVERDIVLSVVDAKWIDYLHNLDALRESIGLRAYGQKDPLIEYKREAYDLFQQLSYDIQREVVLLFFRSRIEISVPMPLAFDEDDEAALAAALAGEGSHNSDGTPFLSPSDTTTTDDIL